MTETGKSKPRPYFAAAHPDLPDPVRDLFHRIVEYLNLI
jgi:hypothetical protein